MTRFANTFPFQRDFRQQKSHRSKLLQAFPVVKIAIKALFVHIMQDLPGSRADFWNDRPVRYLIEVIRASNSSHPTMSSNEYLMTVRADSDKNDLFLAIGKRVLGPGGPVHDGQEGLQKDGRVQFVGEQDDECVTCGEYVCTECRESKALR